METAFAALSRLDRPGYFAVKVRTRAECNISKTLRQKGFEVLVPTCPKPRAQPTRQRKADTALFPGYVFVRLDPRELLSLVTTDGVSYIVRSGATIEPLPIEEELTVRTLCDHVTGFEPCNQFAVGQRVWIESGPFKGRQGTLARVGDQDRLVLSLNSIFSSVSIDLRDTTVRVCE